MPHIRNDSPTAKKLEYLLHRQIFLQECKFKCESLVRAEQKQQDRSMNKGTTILPKISSKNRYKSIQTEHQRTIPISTTSRNQQNQYRQTMGKEISGKEYIEVNKSILKMIEQKIYPMNKELAQKMKFKNNISFQTVKNTQENMPDDSTSINKTSIQKNKQKHKKKNKLILVPGQISDQILGLNHANQRTKSQQEIIRLQTKVETYLTDKKKLLKFQYDQEIQNIAQNSINRSKITQSNKQQAKLHTIKRLMTIHSSKNKKSQNSNPSNNSFTIQNQSQLKRLIKLFHQNVDDYTCLENKRQEKFRQIKEQGQLQRTLQKQNQIKDLSTMSSKDLSKSLKLISKSLNKKLQQIQNIHETQVKVNYHQQIFPRVIRKQEIRQVSQPNKLNQKKLILQSNKQNCNPNLQVRSQLKLSQNIRTKVYRNEVLNETQKHHEKYNVGVPTQQSPLKTQIPTQQFPQKTKISTPEKTKTLKKLTPEKVKTQKKLTDSSCKSKKSIKPKNQQEIACLSQEKTNEADLNVQKSYKILPSQKGKTLNKELLRQIQQQMLDDKKNLMKRKINEKKLIKRRKDSCIVGISIL